MQLWGIDIVGGQLVNPVTGEIREAKIVTGVDDHSRFCVIAAVVERATARAVCLAIRPGAGQVRVPEEVITDNGKQFTDRFSRYGPTRGEVLLFDKICRHNAITHRLTSPASPNQNGKVERFHGTFRPEITEQGPFVSLAEAQAAIDGRSPTTATGRIRDSMRRAPVVPADRFVPAGPSGLELWVPPSLEPAPEPDSAPATEARPDPANRSGAVRERGSSTAIELSKPVPGSGNMTLCG